MLFSSTTNKSQSDFHPHSVTAMSFKFPFRSSECFSLILPASRPPSVALTNTLCSWWVLNSASQQIAPSPSPPPTNLLYFSLCLFFRGISFLIWLYNSSFVYCGIKLSFKRNAFFFYKRQPAKNTQLITMWTAQKSSPVRGTQNIDVWKSWD